MTAADRARPPEATVVPQVVVGLVNDGLALAVARRGVELAASLGASLRFVQVVPEDLDPTERAEAESATFSAGLKALQRSRHRGAVFESPSGDPAALLVARSAKAVGLVVGDDRGVDEVGDRGVQVAAHCRAHARCPVHIVPRDDAGADIVLSDRVGHRTGPKPLGDKATRT